MVLEQIRLAAPIRLYAHCDGPRPGSKADLKNVEAVHQLIERKGPGACTELRTLFRTENLGLRRGVYEALNWFFSQEEYGIILEDDCVPDLSFFTYCTELLDQYRDEKQVMHIAGSNLAETECRHISTSYLFSNLAFVWGWASWRRAWQQMQIDLDGLEVFERNNELERFLGDPVARHYLQDKFEETRAEKNNSWAYAWLYSIIQNEGLCIVPKVNLIQNRGIGGENATNTRKRNKRASLQAQAMEFPMVHPDRIQAHKHLELVFFYKTQKSRWRLKIWGLLRALGLR